MQRFAATLLVLALLGGSAPFFSPSARHACCRTKACPMMAKAAKIQCTIASCDHTQALQLPAVLAVLAAPGAAGFDLPSTVAPAAAGQRAPEGVPSAIDHPPQLG